MKQQKLTQNCVGPWLAFFRAGFREGYISGQYFLASIRASRISDFCVSIAILVVISISTDKFPSPSLRENHVFVFESVFIATGKYINYVAPCDVIQRLYQFSCVLLAVFFFFSFFNIPRNFSSLATLSTVHQVN